MPRFPRFTQPEVPKSSALRSEPTPEPRPWLYLEDTVTAAPMHVIGFTRGTYTSVSSPTRPFGANVARPGGVLEVGAEAGLLPWLSLAASAMGGGEQGGGFGGLAGVRLAPFAGRWQTTHLVLAGGYLRELSGGSGAWGRLALSQDVGRLRLASTVHGEHVFLTGRDAFDVMVMLGASYKVAGPLRAGVEYVAQDLEGALDSEEAEGGCATSRGRPPRWSCWGGGSPSPGAQRSGYRRSRQACSEGSRWLTPTERGLTACAS